MKRVALLPLLALLGCAASVAAVPAQAALPVQHWTQPNGVQVYLIESPAIPMVDFQVDFDAGSRRDPAAKIGLAEATADMAIKTVHAGNGHPGMDENAVSEAWADLGAQFDLQAGNDRMSYTLRTLTYPEVLDKAVQLAALQMGQPAFASDIWARERARLGAALDEANTHAETQAQRAFYAAVFGRHPYGYEPTRETLAHISVADMRALYARAVKPCAATVSVVGAVTREQADALVRKLFARFPASNCSQALPPVAEVLPLAHAVDRHIPFDSAQAQILLGQPGFKRDDPDFLALLVGNHMLGGGGFTSRLTDEVREKRGLSYSVDSSFDPGLHAGAFTISLQTRPDQAAQALQVARQVLEEFVRSGPTEAQLAEAKDNLVGGFALRIDSNQKLLDNLSSIAWNKLPLDYLDHWAENVAKLTVADVRAAMARKLNPAKMVTVVLGAK
jgi:zinc protease